MLLLLVSIYQWAGEFGGKLEIVVLEYSVPCICCCVKEVLQHLFISPHGAGSPCVQFSALPPCSRNRLDSRGVWNRAECGEAVPPSCVSSVHLPYTAIQFLLIMKQV